MKKLTCPCCGYRTMDNDGHYDICPICFWEDDPFQKEDVYETGANKIPLIEAQKNYLKYGACEKEFQKNVRQSKVNDKRDPDWKPINDPLYELNLACRKFKEETYCIGELGRALSWIAVPDEFSEIVKQVEYDLEMIRFCTSDYKQREEAIQVIDNMLDKLNICIEESDD